MEIVKRSLLIISLTFSAIYGISNQYDYFVSNNKIVFLKNDITQRDPSISAAFLENEKMVSAAVSYWNYYLRRGVDNIGGDEKVIAGLTISGKRLASKTAIGYFSFSNIYSELALKNSFAIHCYSKFAVGINSELLKKKLLVLEDLEKNVLNLSVTFSGKNRSFFYSLELDGINISQRSLYLKMIYLNLQGNTYTGRIVNQGVKLSLCPTEIKESCFFWAVKVLLLDRVFLNLSMSTNPLLFGLGIDFKIRKTNLFAGALTHPVLGTSMHVGMDHLFMRR